MEKQRKHEKTLTPNSFYLSSGKDDDERGQIAAVGNRDSAQLAPPSPEIKLISRQTANCQHLPVSVNFR
jgi:hypothetical protein